MHQIPFNQLREHRIDVCIQTAPTKILVFLYSEAIIVLLEIKRSLQLKMFPHIEIFLWQMVHILCSVDMFDIYELSEMRWRDIANVSSSISSNV